MPETPSPVPDRKLLLSLALPLVGAVFLALGVWLLLRFNAQDERDDAHQQEHRRQQQELKEHAQEEKAALLEMTESCEKARAVDRSRGDTSGTCAICKGTGMRLDHHNVATKCPCCDGRGKH